MSTTVEAQPDVRPDEVKPSNWRHGPRGGAPWALARVEGRRLVRNPLFLFATLAGLSLFVALTWRAAPTLQLDAILAGAALMPMAAAAFLVANLAAFRSRRHDTDELYDGLVVSPAERTKGHLLSMAWAGAAAVLVLVIEGAYLIALRPTGIPNLFELLTGPAAVVLLGCAGVLLGRWVPSAVAGPVALVVCASLWAFVDSRWSTGSQGAKWLTPWVPARVNPELLIRPAALHLAYVAALIAVVSVLAVWRDSPGNGVRTIAVVTAGLVAITAWGITRPPSAAQAAGLVALERDPVAHETCRDLDAVQYCAFGGYLGWIGRWQAVAQSTLAPVPIAARPQGLELTQVMPDIYSSDVPVWYVDAIARGRNVGPRVGDAITPGTRWGRGAWEGRSQLGLSLQLAARVIGYPAGPVFDNEVQACRASGQAKAVVAIWLAAQATAASGSALRAANREFPYGIAIDKQAPETGSAGSSGFSWPGPYSFSLSDAVTEAVGASAVEWGTRESSYAAQLLGKPRQQVVSTLAANWGELTDPGTPTSRLVELFGLRPLPSLRAQLESAGATPDVIDQMVHSFESGLHPCP